MKIRISIRRPKTPEQERLWLLHQVNRQLNRSRTFWGLGLAVSAFLLLLGLLAAFSQRWHH